MAAQKAKEMQAMAGGTWDKLEQVFEDRVARALSKLGVHTQADVERLSQRVEALSEAVNELIKAQAAAGRSASADEREEGWQARASCPQVHAKSTGAAPRREAGSGRAAQVGEEEGGGLSDAR